jgi:hypothetical protein
MIRLHQCTDMAAQCGTLVRAPEGPGEQSQPGITGNASGNARGSGFHPGIATTVRCGGKLMRHGIWLGNALGPSDQMASNLSDDRRLSGDGEP